MISARAHRCCTNTHDPRFLSPRSLARSLTSLGSLSLLGFYILSVVFLSFVTFRIYRWTVASTRFLGARAEVAGTPFRRNVRVFDHFRVVLLSTEVLRSFLLISFPKSFRIGRGLLRTVFAQSPERVPGS